MSDDTHARDDDDPRGADVGAGYPEENQPGTTPGGDAPESERTEDDDPSERERAPDTTSEQEGEPGQATGNPRAAGS